MAKDWNNDDVECVGDEQDIVSWVEVRVVSFRVKGQQSVFVLPAWDIHLKAKAVREIRNQPFVQTVVRGKSSQQARETVKERSDARNDTDTLKGENNSRQLRLQYGKDRM